MSEAAASLFRLGISLPCIEAAALHDIEDIPECFEVLELSGEMLSYTLNQRSEDLLLAEFEEINFRNILPANLTDQLTSADDNIVNEYKKQLRELMAQAHECGSEYVSIDPDWETLFDSAERRKVLDDVLRSTAGDRANNKLVLALAVRIPGAGVQDPVKSLDFLRSVCNYNVKLVLNINVHELLKSDIDWQEVLKSFRFDTAAVRFCYPSELGNKLLYKHIEPFIEALKKWKQETIIYIAPSGRADFTEIAGMLQAISPENDQQ